MDLVRNRPYTANPIDPSQSFSVDLQTIWIILLSISTPVAGVVGFAIQLRLVKKARLDNEKLQLEIEALRARAVEADRRIVLATFEEIEKYNDPDIRFRRSGPEDPSIPSRPRTSFGEAATLGLIALGLLLLTGYFVYDVYRFAAWLWGRL